MVKNIPFKHFGAMLDCSRNGVMKSQVVKVMIDYLSQMGYNTLMLYTEDTYEVDNQPYFGYLRGRYSQMELMAIDQYARSKGIELIPCIQALAHLNAIMRWPQYRDMSDCDDILCIGDERVYRLLEDIFATLDRCFTSRTVNIGMDEAYMLGLGRYREKNGYPDRTEIFLSHLNKVAKIGKKYGFTLCMWSDMFFRLATGEHYGEGKLDSRVKDLIPENVQLIYWDYDNWDKAHYDSLMKRHKELQEDIWFAGGAYTWTGFAPHNSYSIEAAQKTVECCIDNRVSHMLVTLWGDNGNECSKFSALPTLFTISELVKGNTDMEDIRCKFQKMFGLSFDQFMLLELPDTANAEGVCNPDKYMLYSDCFLGPWDSTVRETDAQRYKACAEKLAEIPEEYPLSYIFNTQKALCNVLACKFDLGLRTRKAYQKKDRSELQSLLPRYEDLVSKLEILYKAFEKQWMTENKPHGFDVQDIRLGGLMRRVTHCRERLSQYLDGQIETLEELEEPLLEVFGRGADFEPVPVCFNDWKTAATANVL